MAKRKRLSPAAVWTDPGPAAAAPTRAPIAEVAGDASARAALDELSHEMAAARAEGRLIQELALDEIEAGHLLRDRIAADDAEMAALKSSIAARGQQVPIEVTDLGAAHPGPRYGLISGWRRLSALRALHAETGEAGFARIRAVLRSPDGAPEAYLAMVEENEIRVGLSYYERARVAARSAEAGVFEDAQAAIRALFASASKAKRSKIASFVTIYRELDEVLAWPAAIPERLGLQVSKALAEGGGKRIRAALFKAAPADADAELAALTKALRGTGKGRADPPATAPEVIPGVRLKRGRNGLSLTGPGVDATLEAALQDWLKARAGGAH